MYGKFGNFRKFSSSKRKIEKKYKKYGDRGRLRLEYLHLDSDSCISKKVTRILIMNKYNYVYCYILYF